MNIDVFIPVRLGSSRLPKKAMRQVNGKPIIKYLIERLQNTKKIRKLVICTTTSNLDDELVEYMRKERIDFFRGNVHDILIRYLDATNEFGTDFIVNVEGDDIYTDPVCVDKIVEEFEKTNADYIDIAEMPFGLSPSGIKTMALQKVCSIKKTNNTETGYKRFFTETNMFEVKHIKLEKTLKFSPNTRLTLDYQEDLDLAKEIFTNMGNNFHKEDIVDLFERKPELLNITKDLENRYNKYYYQNITDISTKDM
jgi:spore coat polysaccharide biosynthesis protein SpsF (cytidylyltransferase family)